MFMKQLLLFVITLFIALFIALPHTQVLAEDERNLDAVIVEPAELPVGSEKLVQVSIQNNMVVETIDPVLEQLDLVNYYGSAVGLTAMLKENEAPVTIKVGKMLIGSLLGGEAVKQVPFLIKADEEANPGNYFLLLELSYKNLSNVDAGEQINLEWVEIIETIELPIEIVDKPLNFETVYPESNLRPGDKAEFSLLFVNNSDKTARHATARISATAPFSITDDTAYLGKLEHGDEKIGIFEVKIDGNALPKEYVIETQIKYVDSDGNEQFTDTTQVPIEIKSHYPFFNRVANSPLATGLLGALAMGMIMGVWLKTSYSKTR